jgi:hypothetical protein
VFPYITFRHTTLKATGGLSGLMAVGGSVTFVSNAALVSTGRFNNDLTIGGGVYIERNSKLESAPGLAQIGTIGGSLRVTNNPVLERIEMNGLLALESVIVSDNALLQVLTFPGIEAASLLEVTIHSNPHLTEQSCVISALCRDDAFVCYVEYAFYGSACP